jgi:hypothetical protein
MQNATPNPAPRPTADEPLYGLLAAVLEALDIPAPATVGGADAYRQALEDRAMHARVALENVLVDDGTQLGIEWETEYLRERLAEHSPTGYTSSEQARAALAAGKSWMEAVQPPERGEQR